MNDTKPKPLISVIIVNYNSGSLLLKSVQSVLTQSIPVEVIVADNNSTDFSLDLLPKKIPKGNTLDVVRNDENLGFSVAANQGIKRSKGKFVLLLNPDCIVDINTLQHMVEIMGKFPNAGMAGCLIMNPDGSEQVGCRRLIPTPYRSLKRALNLDKIFRRYPKFQSFNMLGTPLPGGPVSTEAISGAFMFIRRSVLDEIGLLDENYFMHCEDLDWCMRFRNAGKDILFVPNATAVHYQGSCSKRNPVKVLWFKHAGMVIFYKKFLRARYPLPLMFLVVLSVWSRFVLLAAPLAIQSWFAKERVCDSCNDSVPLVPDQVDSGHDRQGSVRDTFDPQEVVKQLKDERLFITGGSGFIGTRLIQSINNLSPVTVLTRKESISATQAVNDRVEIVQGDLLEQDSMPKDMLDSIDCIIHLASYVHQPKEREIDEKHFAVTEDGTRYLINRAVQAGVKKFIYVSSVKAMGENTDSLADEQSSCHPDSPYGQSKLAAEKLVLDLAKKHGMHVCVLRLPMVYGAGNKGNLPQMISQIDKNRFPPLPDIDNKRSMVHVDDVVQAILLAIYNKNADGKIFIVTDGEFYSTRNIYLEIYKQLKGKSPSFSLPVFVYRFLAKIGDMLGRIKGRPFIFNSDIYRKLFDSAYYSSDKIQDELGYKVTKTFHTALPDMINEYRKCQ